MKNLFKFLVMDAAGDNGGGGGSVLTGIAGGGANNATQGQQNTGNPPASQGAPANNGNQGGSTSGNQTQDWRTALPTEFRDDPALKVFNDVGALAKSYIHAQKMVGADKIIKPGKHSSDDDWKNVFEQLGLPKDLKEYDVKMKEGVSIDKDFVEKFKAAAHKSGILPKQAQGIADWFAEVNSASEAEVLKQAQAQRTEKLQALEKEWGGAYKPKLEKAAQVLREFGNKELFDHMDATHLGDDPHVIKLLASIQEKYMAEAKGDIGGDNNLNAQLTPAEASKEYGKILADAKHPYYDAAHPNHKAAVKEVAGLFSMAHPSAKK
jgi:hypothetical protein